MLSKLPGDERQFLLWHSLGLRQGRYVLFLGRLVPEKRPDLLIKAFQALKPPGWKLVLVGGTSDTNSFTSQITSLAPVIRCSFTGELHGKYLVEIVRGAGLLYFLVWEGLPLAMLEAMRSVPVLAKQHSSASATNSWSRSHAVCIRGTGMLFQAGDVDSCVRTLDWAIHHPAELATMAGVHKGMYRPIIHITTETLRLYKTLSTSPNIFSKSFQTRQLRLPRS